MMTLDDFHIGLEFICGNARFRCTDKGTRTICAIRVDRTEVGGDTRPRGNRVLTKREAMAENWFSGPPYGVAESSFDEYDQEGCTPVSRFMFFGE